MIININRTQATDRLFDVFYDNKPKYTGKLGRYSAVETFSLRNTARKVNLTGAYSLPSPLDMVPLIYLLGRPKVVHNCYCQNGMKRLGTIGCYEVGIRKSHHRITDASGRKFIAYHFLKDGIEYLPIYLDDGIQVAMVEAHPATKDSRSRYKLYILDDYGDCADIFSMFVMYFANWYDADRGTRKNNSGKKHKKPTRSYADKFDPEWHIKNFPAADSDEDAR